EPSLSAAQLQRLVMAHGPANVLTALTRQRRAGRLRRLPANAPAGRGTPDGFLPVRRNYLFNLKIETLRTK
ncbi:MAG: hypothetical protein WBF31_21885, partial [Anaerolineae bacterium]